MAKPPFGTAQATRQVGSLDWFGFGCEALVLGWKWK